MVNIVPVTGSASELGVSNVVVSCRAGTSWFRIPITDSPEHKPTREFQLNLVASGRVIVGPRAGADLLVDDLNYPTTPARGVAGVVEAMANAPGGGVYLGGDFTGVNGVPLSRVARLLPDGEVDTDFDPDPGPNADVTALAVQSADGKVLIAGDFTAVDGVPRAGLARLNPDGSLDASFDPGLGAQSASAVAFPPTALPFIRVLLPQRDGSVFVAGDFTGFDNHPSGAVAKLQADGQVDDTFTSPFVLIPPYHYYPPSWSYSVPGIPVSGITALIQQPDVYFVAAFSNVWNYPVVLHSIYSLPQGRLVRFDWNGQLDTTFGTNDEVQVSTPVASLAVTPSGEILAGGSAWTNRSWVIVQQFTTNGQVDAGFQVHSTPQIGFARSAIRQLLVQPDGRILFSAAIYTNNPIDTNTPVPLLESHLDRAIIGRLHPDGAWDNSFHPLVCALPLLREQPGPFWFNHPSASDSTSSGPVPTVSMALQPDGVLVLAGAFDSANGQPRRRLARVNADGTLRGQLILRLTGNTPLHLLLPPEVQTPYMIQTSTDLKHWSDWLLDNYPWWPFTLSLSPEQPARFFRANPVKQ